MHFAVHPLVKLIAEGEGPSLDFKKTISSAKKIARTLVAFANTHGGSLLVGVRDNGTISGIRSEEEMYMIDSAARVFCQPPVRFEYKMHEYKGMAVLQVVVPESYSKPHLARAENDEWRIFLRINDKTVLASPLVEEFLRRDAQGVEGHIRFGDVEREALAYLAKVPHATQRELGAVLMLDAEQTAELLINLLTARLVELDGNDREELFRLADDDPEA